MEENNIVYVRCSTDMQDTTHQKNSIKNYCLKNNINIKEIVVEEGVSAFSTSYKDRKINNILNYTSKIDNLIIYESTRLSRNMQEGQEIINKFTLKGTLVHSVQEGILNKNDIDRLLNAFRYFNAEEESKKISLRIKSSKELQRKNLEYLGGKVAFGYKVADKKFEIIEEEANIIRSLFNLYLNTNSSSCIKYLENNNVFTLGKRSKNQELLQILKNKIYIGYPYNNSNEHDCNLAIVDLDTFNKVQETISSRSIGERNGTILTAKSNTLLEGLVYASCNKKMVIDFNYNKKDKMDKTKIFKSRCKCNKEIHQKSFIADEIEKNVEEQLFNYFNKLDINKLREAYLQEIKVKESNKKSSIKELNNKIKLSNKKLEIYNNSLEELILNGLNANAINIISNKIELLKVEINALEEQIKLANIKVKDTNYLEELEIYSNFKSIYKLASFTDKKILLRTIIDKIIINSYEEIDIYLKINL